MNTLSLQCEKRMSGLDLIINKHIEGMLVTNMPRIHHFPKKGYSKKKLKLNPVSQSNLLKPLLPKEAGKSVDELCLDFYSDEISSISSKEWLVNALKTFKDVYGRKHSETLKDNITQSFIFYMVEDALRGIDLQDVMYKFNGGYERVLESAGMRVLTQDNYLMFMEKQGVITARFFENALQPADPMLYKNSLVFYNIYHASGSRLRKFAIRSIQNHGRNFEIWLKGLLEVLCLELSDVHSSVGIAYLTGLLNELGIIQGTENAYQVAICPDPPLDKWMKPVRVFSPLVLFRNMKDYFTHQRPNSAVITELSTIVEPEMRDNKTTNIYRKSLSETASGLDPSKCDVEGALEASVLSEKCARKSRVAIKQTKEPEAAAYSISHSAVTSDESMIIAFKRIVAQAKTDEALRFYKEHRNELETHKSWTKTTKPLFVFLLRLDGVKYQGIMKKYNLQEE